ncbi:MAG TPA: hypothetical protein VHE53_02895 [Patescibacteria group bacterium]|nr:hypothetical protein [Patescibacteria group bacterium]
MKKIIFLILLIAITFAIPQKANAMTRNESAQLSVPTADSIPTIDMRTKALENVFKRHNSPLTVEASAYIKYADQYGVDWKLLPAISGVESSFGIALMPDSYNAYGWGGGHIYFNSWEDGIRSIDEALGENYYAKGATDVWKIGPIYAESPTWSVRVNGYMNEIEEEYERLTLFSNLPTI